MAIRLVELHLALDVFQTDFMRKNIEVKISLKEKTLDITTDKILVTPTEIRQLLKRPTP